MMPTTLTAFKSFRCTDSMTDFKKIMAFCLRFDGMVNNMAQCKITIPPILLVMFFLWSLHPCYEALLKQLHSWYKSLESASLDSIVADIRYHDKFNLVGLDNKKSPAGKTPRADTAATNVDKQGKEWNNPLEWLSTLQANSFKKWQKQALAGNGICPICHRVDNRQISLISRT
jgi:hypothetical protein